MSNYLIFHIAMTSSELAVAICKLKGASPQTQPHPQHSLIPNPSPRGEKSSLTPNPSPKGEGSDYRQGVSTVLM